MVGFNADGGYDTRVLGKISEMAANLYATEQVLVDIPIGLKGIDNESRLCDREARTLLKPRRHASVFSAPSRCALDCTSYTEANTRQRACSGKGMSKQTFNILAKIREMDGFLHNNRYRDKIREMHPEVCFWALNHEQAMQHNKKTDAGFQERMHVLQRYRPDADDIVTTALQAYPRVQVGRDDIVDALVGAMTATQVKSLHCIPERPEIDDHGLPMEIVYWSPQG